MDGEGQASSGRIDVRRQLFCKLKSYKIEGRKRNVALATDVKFDPGKATFVGMECGEGIGETGWVLVE